MKKTRAIVLRAGVAVVPAAPLFMLVMSAGEARGQDAVATVNETVMESEVYNPGPTPGREQGDRTRKVEETPEAPTAATPEEREWFGGKSYWTWSRATGDWGGVRTWLEDRGVTLAGSYTLDWSSVWDGGLRNVASTRSMLDLNATVDIEKLGGWSGATFFADFQSSDMRGGTRDVGDLHAIDDIETGDNVDQIAEVWFEQKLFDNFLRVKVGKIDSNLEFAFPVYTGEFTVSTDATPPSQFLSMPTWPNPSMGAVAFIYPTDNLYFGAGFFDGGNAVGRPTGRLGPRELWHGSEFYWTGEGGLTWKELGGLGVGRLAAGAWYHSGTFEKFNGSSQDGTYGFYGFFEQQLVRREGSDSEDPKGLFFLLQYDHGDDDVNAVANHVAAGLVTHGTFGSRGDDSAGVYFSWLDLSTAEGATFEDDESLAEAFYKIQVTPFFSVKPALQYIWNPGGDAAVDDALVGAVRFEVTF
jgi:porin